MELNKRNDALQSSILLRNNNGNKHKKQQSRKKMEFIWWLINAGLLVTFPRHVGVEMECRWMQELSL